MLHALAPSGPGTSFDLPDVVVTSLGWYSTTEIGTVTGNWACFGFTNYHVHHDFMQPTGSQYCLLNKNNNLLQLNANWQKENNAHWVHSLVHAFGTACLVPGPQAADFLLASGGPMEGTGVPGEPTRKLAAGEIPSIAASTCFAGTTWCGTLTVTQPVLLAAYIYWLNTYGIQPSTSGYVYGPDADADYIRIGFHHYGGYQNTPPAYYSLYIRSAQAGWVIIDPQGSPVASGGNAPGESGCLGCAEEGFAIDWYPSVSPAPAITGYQAQWPTSVGGNPTQQQANQWVQDRISQGHWNDSASALKSALDAAIRPASNLRGMHSSGITESPSFDGRLWE